MFHVEPQGGSRCRGAAQPGLRDRACPGRLGLRLWGVGRATPAAVIGRAPGVCGGGPVGAGFPGGKGFGPPPQKPQCAGAHCCSGCSAPVTGAATAGFFRWCAQLWWPDPAAGPCRGNWPQGAVPVQGFQPPVRGGEPPCRGPVPRRPASGAGGTGAALGWTPCRRRAPGYRPQPGCRQRPYPCPRTPLPGPTTANRREAPTRAPQARRAPGPPGPMWRAARSRTAPPFSGSTWNETPRPGTAGPLDDIDHSDAGKRGRICIWSDE